MSIKEKENRMKEATKMQTKKLLEMIAAGQVTVEKALELKDGEIQFWHRSAMGIMEDIPHILWARDRGERFVPKRRDL